MLAETPSAQTMFILQEYLTCVKWVNKTRNNLFKTLEYLAAVRGWCGLHTPSGETKGLPVVHYAEGTLGPGYS